MGTKDTQVTQPAQGGTVPAAAQAAAQTGSSELDSLKAQLARAEARNADLEKNLDAKVTAAAQAAAQIAVTSAMTALQPMLAATLQAQKSPADLQAAAAAEAKQKRRAATKARAIEVADETRTEGLRYIVGPSYYARHGDQHYAPGEVVTIPRDEEPSYEWEPFEPNGPAKPLPPVQKPVSLGEMQRAQSAAPKTGLARPPLSDRPSDQEVG